MSDLTGGRPPASTSTGRGNGNGNGNGRAQAPPGTTGSPGIKGPRDIMRERNAREARRKAEQEQQAEVDRLRAVEEQRLAEEEVERRRISAERRAAAGAAGQQRGSGDAGQRGSGNTTGQRISDNSQRSERRSGDRIASGGEQPLQGLGRGGSAIGGGATVTARPRQNQQQGPRPVQPETVRTRPVQVPAEAGPSNSGPGSSDPLAETGQSTALRSSFPHAFERWETLSAHWEGLTSFWIRRLQENSQEINRDPLSQQLSRQVTDLSAAGANLFHAVVELQRLRASSERKFQRWFFETRAEQERMQEVQAVTEQALQRERAERTAMIAEGVNNQSDNSKWEKLLAEKERELQISKEEARRAWEELGRREEEERERTASLREGLPTVVGGVQVVPMMAGAPSRHASTRAPASTSDGQYVAGPSGLAPEPEGPVDDPDVAYQQYSRSQRSDPEDPFVQPQRVPTTRNSPAGYTTASSLPTHPAFTNSHEVSRAPAVQPATTGFYTQTQGTSLHPSQDPTYRASASAPSEGAFSEEEYEIDSQGQFIRDVNGNKIRYQGPPSDDDTDEYDVAAEREREEAHRQRYPTSSSAGTDYGSGRGAGRGDGTTAPTSAPSSVDYSGQGYGSSAPEWSAVPRHHHPTRLSDVLEEDERSRTDASQVSRRGAERD